MYIFTEKNSTTINGASLSEPHTSKSALKWVNVCMYVCGHIPEMFYSNIVYVRVRVYENSETISELLCTGNYGFPWAGACTV